MKDINGCIYLKCGKVVGAGWIRSLPDLRDYDEQHTEVRSLVKSLKLVSSETSLPTEIDLTKWCSPIEDQGEIGSCTAQASIGLVEYFQNRAFNKYIDASALFVYKVTRNLMQVSGDRGAFLRTAMAALAVCGVAPEKYWKYTDDKDFFDLEPTSFVYSTAENFKALRYFCHDPIGQHKSFDDTLLSIKRFLAAGIPAMFGFYGFDSFENSNEQGAIPYPTVDESARWGHAVVAVGYQDNKKIKNKSNGETTTGALLIRNSWGGSWGNEGYGWIPYKYVLSGLACDFWSLYDMEWINTKKFGL